MQHLKMMPGSAAAVGVLLLILLLAAGGCRDGERTSAAVAAPDPAVIDMPLLRAYADRLSQQGGNSQELEPDTIMRHVANMSALLAEGREQGLLETPAFRQAVHQYQAELLLRTMQAELVPEIPRESVSDEEVREFFTANLDRYRLSQQESGEVETYFERRLEYLRNDVLLGRYRQAWDEAYQRLRAKHGTEVPAGLAGEFRAQFD